MLVWEGTVRNSESRSRSLQLVRLSALHNFKVCGALRTLVGVNGIVPFVPPLSKNHCARGRTYQAVVGEQRVNSVICVECNVSRKPCWEIRRGSGMLVWEGTVRNSESRSRSLQLVRLSALHNFKVCIALRTLVGVNGIVPFVPPLSKNHCARGRTYQAVVGDQGCELGHPCGIQWFSK